MKSVGNEVETSVDDGPGYWVGPLLTSSELSHIRSVIFQQLLSRVEEVAPSAVRTFAEAGLENYHEYCHLVDHAKIWSRSNRLFPRDGIEFLQNSSMMQRLSEAFGPCEITNEVEGGPPEIVWRLVRPNEAEDVGPLHTDRWFWELNKWPIRDHCRLIKVWTMVFGEPGLAGLRVVPGSNRNPWPYQGEFRHGVFKPLFDEAANGVDPVLLPTPAGTSVVFAYDLLHGGAVTNGDASRVSFEFTLLVPAK